MAHEYYNRAAFPHFVVNHGNWDIYANDAGHCAAIPTADAAADGCGASNFGDARYVFATLGAKVCVGAGQ
jgi:hypothetical protein